MNPMHNLQTFDYELLQLLGETQHGQGLTMYAPESPAILDLTGQNLSADAQIWSAEDQLFAEMMASPYSSAPSSVASSPTQVDNVFTFQDVLNLPALTPETFVSDTFSSPEFASLSTFEQPAVWGSPAESVTAMFPKLSPRTSPVPSTKPISPVVSPSKPALAPAIDPLSAVLMPFGSNIGATAASLANNAAAVAAAASAAGVPVHQLQQQLQSIANMHARQTPTLVKTTVELDPPYTVGRKRKERSTDAAAILAELDSKRQKNTEAARRSRAKRMERMTELEDMVKALQRERDEQKQKILEMETKQQQQALKEAELQSQIAQLQATVSSLQR
ncbi:hypothetical protein DFS34DRAFT_607171 [Phlyctochytrium arcticum]|nr:hypothetical protein DFS34DRAFT_607171 [Phlyctochytrium arcticum]